MAKEEVYDAGNETHVKTRKSRIQLERERSREEMRKLMANRQVRKLLWDLMEYCMVFRTFGELDSHDMAIASGRRDAGLWILEKVLEVDPSLLIQMKEEN